MPKDNRRKATFKSVVQLALTPELVADILTLGEEDFAVMWDAVLREVEGGGKFSLSYDTDKRQYSASMFEQALESANAGLMVFANGDTADRAIAALIYKLRHVAGGRPWLEVATNRGEASVS